MKREWVGGYDGLGSEFTLLPRDHILQIPLAGNDHKRRTHTETDLCVSGLGNRAYREWAPGILKINK